MSAESFPFSFCPAVHTIAALLLPSGLGFCVPDTQSQGELMQQRVFGGPVCLFRGAAGHSVPSAGSRPSGLGKGSSTPCSCTAVLFLLSLYQLLPLKFYRRHT